MDSPESPRPARQPGRDADFGALAWATSFATAIVVTGVGMVGFGVVVLARWPESSRAGALTGEEGHRPTLAHDTIGARDAARGRWTTELAVETDGRSEPAGPLRGHQRGGRQDSGPTAGLERTSALQAV